MSKAWTGANSRIDSKLDMKANGRLDAYTIVINLDAAE